MSTIDIIKALKEDIRVDENNKDNKDKNINEDKEKINEGEILVRACSKCGIFTQVQEGMESEDECPYCGKGEIQEKIVKVVRDGKVVKKNVSSKKKKLSSKQKSALAKARKKAHTSSAQKQRNKSMKKARKLNDEDTFECAECGYSGKFEDFVNGLCPDCGAELEA